MISIVIPVYNEGPNIERVLRQIHESVTSAHEILIVYDFEEDNTLPVIRQLPYTVRLVRNAWGRGVPGALKTGFREAHFDRVVVVMADGSDDLRAIDRMNVLLDRGFDIVCGSRYMSGGRLIGGPVLKQLLSRMAGVSLRIMGLPTHDGTNAFKMYRRTVLQQVDIQSSRGFEISLEILLKAHRRGFRIGQLPTTWTDRSKGESKFKLWRWLPAYFKWYMRAARDLVLGPLGR